DLVPLGQDLVVVHHADVMRPPGGGAVAVQDGELVLDEDDLAPVGGLVKAGELRRVQAEGNGREELRQVARPLEKGPPQAPLRPGESAGRCHRCHPELSCLVVLNDPVRCFPSPTLAIGRRRRHPFSWQELKSWRARWGRCPEGSALALASPVASAPGGESTEYPVRSTRLPCPMPA